MKSIAPKERLGLHLDLPVKFSSVAAEFPDDLEYDDWQIIGIALAKLHQAIPFWIGDFLARGEHRYGEMYSQAEAWFKIDPDRLRNYKWVSDRVHSSLRNDNLSWSHHLEVAKLDPKQQKEWLDEAEAKRLTVRELRERLIEVGLRKDMRRDPPRLPNPDQSSPDYPETHQETVFVMDQPIKHVCEGCGSNEATHAIIVCDHCLHKIGADDAA